MNIIPISPFSHIGEFTVVGRGQVQRQSPVQGRYTEVRATRAGKSGRVVDATNACELLLSE